jgi:hypothetical protein
VMQVGRPLLVVPESCDWLDRRSVLVAWKDTAEARRAVSDALPQLRKCTEVTLSKSSRTRPIAPRRCCGLRMSRRGYRGMA